MKTILFVLLSIVANVINAQDKEIFKIISIMPVFPGCEVGSEPEKQNCTKIKLNEYIANNLVYPDSAIMMAIEGKVFAQFIVDDDGTIQNIQIVRGIKYGCDEASKNVINSMNDLPNKWTPGKHQNMNVPVLMTIPVEFKLDDLVYEDVQHKPYLFNCSHLSDAKAKDDCTKSIISSIGHRLVKYPAAARQRGVQGEVILGFVIDKNGKMEEMEVIQGIGSGCDESAMEAFKNLSKQKLNWVPASQNNTNVNYLYRIPVQFKLGG